MRESRESRVYALILWLSLLGIEYAQLLKKRRVSKFTQLRSRFK